MSLGKISQVVGPVVDVAFSVGDKLPEINNALVVYKNDQQKSKVVLEVALELGDGVVRTIAMESTDGLTRGSLGHWSSNLSSCRKRNLGTCLQRSGRYH